MRLVLFARLALAKAQLRTLLFCSRLMGHLGKHAKPMPQREFMFPHTCICIDTVVSNYEFHYSRQLTDEGVNMVLSVILEEFIGEEIVHNQVSVYRWMPDGTVEDTLMELIFKLD